MIGISELWEDSESRRSLCRLGGRSWISFPSSLACSLRLSTNLSVSSTISSCRSSSKTSSMVITPMTPGPAPPALL